MAVLTIDNVSIRFGEAVIVENINLTIERGELASLLGPSGVGKTTLLKAIGGFITPAGGEIKINGATVNHIPPEKRDVAMVFQQPLLFPHLTVEQNVAFGLRMRGRLDKAEKIKVGKIIELVQLEGLSRRKPNQISGGQQQRVALARALVLDPALLLLDEPLSNLDSNLREQMRALIKNVQRETKTTMLFVTHDQGEALSLSHKIALMLDGKIRQFGSPQKLYHRPIDEQAAAFFGGQNFFPGTIRDGLLQSDLGEFRINERGLNGDVMATIRPEHIQIRKSASSETTCGVIEEVQFEGVCKLVVNVRGKKIFMHTHQGDLVKGREIQLYFPPERIWIFPQKKSRQDESIHRR